MINASRHNITPEIDAQRVEALKRYKIWETPSEKLFDNIAKLATRIFDTPVSLISLVGAEDVHYKANVGMGDVRYAPRRQTICALTIVDPEVTVVENILNEPALMASPIAEIVGDYKFYAGAPLKSSDGFLIGSLCVIDEEQRKFSEADREILKGLAQIVMDEIECVYPLLKKLKNSGFRLKKRLKLT